MDLSDAPVLIKALGSTKSPVTITDARLTDNPIVYCNDAFLSLTGYDRDEVIGQNCRFLQGVDTDKDEVVKLRQAIVEKSDVNVMLLNYTKNGQPFWNDLQMSPVYSEKGELTHFIGLQIDVTQRIEREQALATARQLESEKKLLLSEKEKLLKLNEVKDDFIAIASHQLRTPVTAVKQYLGMLSNGMYGKLTDKQLEAIEVAYRNNERQLSIVDNLLKVAQIDTNKIVLKKHRVNLAKLITGTAEDFKYRLLEANAELSLTLPKKPIYLSIDQHLIRTVFENLIDNAIKYASDTPKLSISLNDLANSIDIVFADNGIGMTASDTEKIFNKFARSESAETKNIGGTGLGLYWAKTVLGLHRATISVSSKKEHGSVFTISFPKQK